MVKIVEENLKGHTADACINGKKKLLYRIRKGDSISGFSNFKSYSWGDKCRSNSIDC